MGSKGGKESWREKVQRRIHSQKIVLLSAVLLVLVGCASSDINKDKAECTDKLIGLAGCLNYVSGEVKVPTIDCCSGLKEVIDKSKRCLCILIKDHDDPNLGFNFNLPLALKLPDACKTPTNITQCIDLLHLPPNSKEAKVFENSSTNRTDSSPPVPTASNATGNVTNTSSDKNSGGWGKRWLVTEVVCGILPLVFLSHLLLFLV